MPNYTYICDWCLEVSEINHGMDEVLTKCPKCESDKIRKMPSNILLLKHKNKTREEFEKTHNPGEVIHETIKETHEELIKEREQLKNRVWSPSK